MSFPLWRIQRYKYIIFVWFAVTLFVLIGYERRTKVNQSEYYILQVRSNQDHLNSTERKTSHENKDSKREQWVIPTGVGEDELLRKIFVDETRFIYDKFTMVTPTYKRTENLPRLFNHYCTMTDIIHRIIILWNNVGKEVPDDIKRHAEDCEVPVTVKIMPRNNLTSRFIPYKEIETAGVLSIDDDLQLSSNSIHIAFSTWKKYPHLLVGYTPRTYFNKNGRYKYHYNLFKGTYTMMMTNVAFIHRKYLELFTDTVPQSIMEFIIKTTNGEDITMNTVVGKYLTDLGRPQCVALYVDEATGLREIGNLSKSGYKGLWRRRGHMSQRSECLNRLGSAYGQLYLHQCNMKLYNETALVPLNI